MELIPAIDLLNNIVVKAFLGERKKYRPIVTKLTNSFKLEEIINGIPKEYKFKKIYIADLNAIMGKKNNFKIINKAVKKFPNIDFWIDYGVKNFLDFKKKENIGFKTIIGSETLENIDEFKKIRKYKNNDLILSLDFKNNYFLGPSNLLKIKKLWPKKIIFMMLDSIGSKKRPEIIKFNKKNFFLKKDFYIAGGISDNQDIKFLEKRGFKGVILSTALHEKKIIYKNL